MEKFCRAVLLALVFVGFGWPVYAQNSLLGDVIAIRAQYPGSLSKEQVAAMLNQVAWNHRAEGWGLLRKGAGNSCPINGTYISCDILVHAPSVTHWDVLRDSENAAIPQWNAAGPCVLSDSSGCQMSNFLPPFDPGGWAPQPQIQPQPNQPAQVIQSFDYSGVIARLDAILAANERQYLDLRAKQNEQTDQAAAVEKRLTDQINQPTWLERIGKVFTNPVVLGVLSGAFGLWGTQQAVK